MKLDLNIVVAITGIEFAYKQDDFSNIIFLLRSASVYLHTNSFFKFILTMKHQDEPVLSTASEPSFTHSLNSDKLF